MKATILSIFLLLVNLVFSQEKGIYSFNCIPTEPEVIRLNDSVPSIGPTIVRVDPNVLVAGWYDRTLEIKSFGRFKINGSKWITAYGLNTDNPTIYGRFRVTGDTLILECKKSIQHFNKLAPKQRVKTNLSNEYRFVIKEDGKLMTSESCFWKLSLNSEG